MSNGEKVMKGQVIALTGNSGRSSGPHLHYEVYENEEVQNPFGFIKNYKFKPMIREIPSPPSKVSAPNVDMESDEKSELLIAMKEIEAKRVKALEGKKEAFDRQKSVAERAKVKAHEALKIAEEARMISEGEQVTDQERRQIAELTAQIEASRAQMAASAKEIEEVKAVLAAKAAEMQAESEELRIVIEEKKVKELKAKKELLQKEKEKEKEKEKKKKKNKK